jgi:hypothetical protein
MHPDRSEPCRTRTYLGAMLPITICEEAESTKEKVSVGRKRDDEGLQDWEKDRDQKRQDEHDESEEIRQEEHDERAQVRREEREERTQAREDERETRRRSP